MSPIVAAKRVLIRKSDGWQDVAVVGPPGAPGGEYELASAFVTSDVNVVGTSVGTATTIMTFPSVIFDGLTPVNIEWFSRSVGPPAGVNNYVAWGLWDNGVFVGTNAPVLFNPLAAAGWASPQKSEFRITPTAGAHVFSIRGWVPSGTAVIAGGQNPGSCMMGRIKRVASIGAAQLPQHYCLARRTTTVGLGAGSNTLSWEAAPINPAAMWSAGQPSRITAKLAGIYKIAAQLQLTGGGGSRRLIDLRPNGAASPLGWRNETGPEGSASPVWQCEGLFQLAVNEYVEVTTYSEVALNFVGTNDQDCSKVAAWLVNT